MLSIKDTSSSSELLIDDPDIYNLFKKDKNEFLKIIDISKYLVTTMIPKIDDKNYYKEMNDKLDNLSKVFITGGNSSKNGKIGELFAYEYFKKNCPDLSYIDTSSIPKSGDGLIQVKHHIVDKIMIDYKNYTRQVPYEEVSKLFKDMDTQNISYGILISYHSKISKKRYIDYEIHKGKLIVFIAGCDMNCLILDVAIQFLLRLSECNVLSISNQADQLILENTTIQLSELLEQLILINQNHTQNTQTIRENLDKINKMFYCMISDSYNTSSSIKLILDKTHSVLNEIHRENGSKQHDFVEISDIVHRIVDREKDIKLIHRLLTIMNEHCTMNYSEKDNSIHFHGKGKLIINKQKCTLIFYSSKDIKNLHSKYELLKNNNYHIPLIEDNNCWKIIDMRIKNEN